MSPEMRGTDAMVAYLPHHAVTDRNSPFHRGKGLCLGQNDETARGYPKLPRGTEEQKMAY